MSISQDAEWLLQEKYSGEKSASFFSDVKKLALGEPLAYLIGHAPFLNTIIYLDSYPLIPRPETEFWTEAAITAITAAKLPAPHILDLCAGSGCVGTAVLANIKTARVDFCEIELTHLTTIKKNLTENHIAAERYQLWHSDLFSALTKDPAHTTYDFILSNPPYIDESLNRVDASVKNFEPHLALFGGKDGMELIAKIIDEAPQHLTPHGQLWLEHEPEQSAVIQEHAKTVFKNCVTKRDQYGTERYTICTERIVHT